MAKTYAAPSPPSMDGTGTPQGGPSVHFAALASGHAIAQRFAGV